MSKDTLTITDNRTGKTYEVPIENGCIRTNALRQIKVSEEDFGLMGMIAIFVALQDARVGPWGVLGLGGALTAVAATASYHLLERPVRRATWRPQLTLTGGALATAAVSSGRSTGRPSTWTVVSSPYRSTWGARPGGKMRSLMPSPLSSICAISVLVGTARASDVPNRSAFSSPALITAELFI